MNSINLNYYTLEKLLILWNKYSQTSYLFKVFYSENPDCYLFAKNRWKSVGVSMIVLSPTILKVVRSCIHSTTNAGQSNLCLALYLTLATKISRLECMSSSYSKLNLLQRNIRYVFIMKLLAARNKIYTFAQ